MTDMDKYKDIINLPHPEPRSHPRMSRINRAAQFAAFAALSGYEDEIDEAGRLTDKMVNLDDSRRDILDHRLQMALDNKSIDISIKYFVPDEKKQGGSYTYATGRINRVDGIFRKVIMENGEEILIDRIVDIDFA